MNNKKKYIWFLVLILIMIISLGTYAWLSWRSNDTAMVLTIGDIDNVKVTLKPYQIDTNISPALTYKGEDYVNVEAVNNSPINKKVVLYYQINSIDTSLVNSNFKYTITRSTDNGSTFKEYKTGNFASAINGSTLEIMNEEVPTDSTYLYKVYVWLNGSNTGQGNIQGATFNGELRAEIKTNYMKADISEDVVFNSEILRSSIEKVTFQNEIPSDITSDNKPIDVSEENDNSVIVYFKDEDNNNLYEMYIAANGQIIAGSLSKFFSFYTNLISIENTNYLDTSQSTSMKGMFQLCINLIELDVSTWNTSNVTDMSKMFMGHSSVGNMKLERLIGIENFDTSKVTDMSAMFQKCSSLTSLDLSNFDTSKVTTMRNMFRNCSGLTTLDLSNLNTSNVTDMTTMFYACSGLTSLDVSNFNTSKVTTMEDMFNGCSSLTSLDVSNFDTSKVTTMEGMFNGCSSLTSLNVSSFDTSKVTTMRNMFRNCSGLTTLDLSNLNTSNVTDMGYMLFNCSSLTSLNVSSFNTSNVINMQYMFSGCSGLTTLDLSSFNTSNVTIMLCMFRNCSGLTMLDLSNFYTPKVTDVRYFASGCTSLNKLDLRNFDISSIEETTAHHVFTNVPTDIEVVVKSEDVQTWVQGKLGGNGTIIIAS